MTTTTLWRLVESTRGSDETHDEMMTRYDRLCKMAGEKALHRKQKSRHITLFAGAWFETFKARRRSRLQSCALLYPITPLCCALFTDAVNCVFG